MHSGFDFDFIFYKYYKSIMTFSYTQKDKKMFLKIYKCTNYNLFTCDLVKI